MKKINAFLMAGILFLSILVIIPSCKKEIYTDEDALTAMKEALKYKNDLAKELATLQLTNQLQVLGLQSQLSIKEMLASDSLSRIGSKTTVSVQVQDVTGSTTGMSGFSVTVNQNGVAKTLTTDANGLVVFPDFVMGTASIIVTKTGFARAAGIMNVYGADYYKETTQQAVIVPVFPTEASTAKIGGTLMAQLDMTTPELEVVQDGIISLNFDDVRDMLYNPNSTGLNAYYGLVGIVYDGGFMQTVKTGADGKYEFKIPKTKQGIEYDFTVSTIKKDQKLLYGDYPNKRDSIALGTMKTWFGYYAGSSLPVYDTKYFTYEYNYGSQQLFAGVNLTIDAPTGGQTPVAPATINWVHMDSTLVTWNYTKFTYNNGANEYTNITQAPVFVYTPGSSSKVSVVTPTAGTVNITNGKINSLYMTNGGVYKEYGRKFGVNGNIAPTQATNPVFKFLEQLSSEDQPNWGTKITYQTAIAVASVALNSNGKVAILFDMTSAGRKGAGYTTIPNVIVKFNTPNTIDTIINQSSLKVNLLTGGSLSIDPIVLSKYTSTTGFTTPAVTISTSKYNGNWQLHGSYTPVATTASYTYKVELLNGFKISDGGLGYTAAPKVRIQNYARKQGTTGSYVLQTIAEAATTLDAQGRIISVSDPVMIDNFEIQNSYSFPGYYPTYSYSVSVPVIVSGKAQAYARAFVDQFGTITNVLLYNEDEPDYEWFTNAYSGSEYFSGKGYVSTPKIKVTPVGKTSVAIPAVLQAVVNSAGRISNIIIVNGGKGYDVKVDPKAIDNPGTYNRYIYTNGVSDIQYDINLGSGYRGDPSDIF
ncbi:MAG: carboxypeptidase-like regulatory domain-containing protein [Methanosarcina sp.]